MIIFSPGRGSCKLLEECYNIAIRACEEGFPFKVCLLARNPKHKEWLEARRLNILTILKQMDLPGEVIIVVKTIEELKNESSKV